MIYTRLIKSKKFLLPAGFIAIAILAGFKFPILERSVASLGSLFEKNPDITERTIINDWEFPKEEGKHPEIKNEYWFFAGHLEEEGKPENKFGITLIFHKNPPHIKVNLADGVHQENFSSRIEIDKYNLLSEDKLAVRTGKNYWLEYALFKYKVHFSFEGKEIDLDLISLKEPFVGCRGQDTFHYQQTRVEATGQLSFGAQKYSVKGIGWIEHHGSKETLASKSFHWYAIQLDNNKELAFTTNLVSESGRFERADSFLFDGELPGGSKKNLPEIIKSADYSIEYLDYWQDPETGRHYPIKTRLEIPSKKTDLMITAIVDNQVIKRTHGFYAGSCRVEGKFEGEAVSGRAQCETIPPQKMIIKGWEFPKEEGEHQRLQSEWWYFVSHLEEKGNPESKFGVTLMFHKNPPNVTVNLSDSARQRNFSSRIYIDDYDLLSKERLAIQGGKNFWLETGLFKYKIHFEFEDAEIDLNLDSIKEPFTRYNTPEAFYYHQTRVKVDGKLSLSGNEYEVGGFGWIDHQGFKEKSLLSQGWRWHALQLDNNTEIVFTSGKNLFIFKDNQKEIIDSADYLVEDFRYWVNPKTGESYPVKFGLKIPSKNTNLTMIAIVNDQLIGRLYEGSCQVSGIFEGEKVSGRAQLEIVPSF